MFYLRKRIIAKYSKKKTAALIVLYLRDVFEISNNPIDQAGRKYSFNYIT